MAARIPPAAGVHVSPLRERAPLHMRLLSAFLIVTAFIIAGGVPILLSGVTGYDLWQGAGRSMEPTFHAGDLLITRDVPASELKVGDVVLFENDDGIHVMHRVRGIEIGEDGRATLTTRGDNNRLDDPPVPESAVIGKRVYDFTWLPAMPIDLSGINLFALEWVTSIALVTLGVLLRRNPKRPSATALRRSYER